MQPVSDPDPESPLASLQQRFLFLILPLTTGISLFVYILSGISLPLAIVTVSATGALLIIWKWRRSDTTKRREILARGKAGIVAGIVATLCYDAFRLGMVKFFHFKFWPLDIFYVFGKALIGTHAPPTLTAMVGALFHIANGIGFAVSYAFFCRRHDIRSGLLWAGILELFMVSLYPGWLGLKAVNEFLQVSLFGHVVYGIVLGAGVHRLLGQKRSFAP